MIKGIDISNWQGGLDLANCEVDFVVVKATGGTYFVDSYCDGWAQWCIDHNRLFGFYHFAKDGGEIASGCEEAEFFVSHCKGYFGKGIPILDLEDTNIPDWRAYAIDFCNRVHDLTGVWPIVYTGLDGCNQLKDSPVTQNCGFWFAGYPLGYVDYWIEPTNVHEYYQIPESCNVIMWQFTSNLPMGGFNLDANYAYMTPEQWGAYVRGDNKPQDGEPGPKPKPDLQDLENALDTIAEYVWLGYFGNGDVRKEEIYNAVQKRVNSRA